MKSAEEWLESWKTGNFWIGRTHRALSDDEYNAVFARAIQTDALESAAKVATRGWWETGPLTIAVRRRIRALIPKEPDDGE